jgi:phospholipid/cholesterol/gamma-HCH transport system substrate-binding protein
MDERKMRFRVGVVALATIFVTTTLVLLVRRGPALMQGTYPLTIIFPQAPSVSPDTPVRKFGIRIGQVTKVGFTENDSGALVEVEINADAPLRIDESFRVTNTLLGDAVIEVIDKDPDTLPEERIEPNSILQGEVRSDPMSVVAKIEGGLADTLASVSRTSDEIGVFARRMSDLLGNNEEQVARIVDKMERTIDQLRSTVSSTDQLLSDPVLRENLRRAIADLPEMLTDARDAIGGLKTTLSGVDRNLANLEGLTRPLGERGGQLVANLDSAAAKLDEVLTEMQTFSTSLNNPRSSLGQLVNSPDVYQQINEAATRLNQLTRDFKPIMRDVRIFTDKVATEPSSIIRRGAGLKYSASEMHESTHSHPPRRVPRLTPEAP